MGNNWLNLMCLLKKYQGTGNKLLLKEKEIFDKIVAERNNEINTLSDKLKHDKLTYYFKYENRIPIGFADLSRPSSIIKKINDGFIDLEKAKEN